MFPMRDHLYELSKVHEIELIQQAQRQRQLAEARNYAYATWNLESIRNVWRTVRRRWQRPPRSTQTAELSRLNVYER